MKKSRFIIVFSTTNSLKAAQRIATSLVTEKLAACVNITSTIHSIYSWKGRLCKEEERLLIVKTRRSLYSRLEKRLKALHPYETPEIISLPVEEGSRSYLDWVSANTIDR